ncbi:MAG: hypothetical protein IIA61_01930 [Candidatus Marinimicrobia bacterium]|nr:hypothetical protein [Candidatus Neomarinimicrobiota bacterium]
MKITQITIWLVISLGLLACGGKKTAEEQTKQEVPAVATHEMSESIMGDIVMYYTCPMEDHKHVQSHEAGKCPECGMELVAVVKGDENNMDFYGCLMPEHSHVRSDQPGKCSECGMDLVPIRLETS